MIIATLAGGAEVIIDPSHGATVHELLARLGDGSLTGSAVPHAGVEFKTASGATVTYEQIEKLEDVAG